LIAPSSHDPEAGERLSETIMRKPLSGCRSDGRAPQAPSGFPPPGGAFFFRHCEEQLRRSNPVLFCRTGLLRSLSSGGHSPDPVARNDGGHRSAFSRQPCPRFSKFIGPQNQGRTRPSREGAGKTGCALHPRSRVHLMLWKMRTRAYRFSGNTPAFPAQWLYGLYRALLGVPLCHHRPRGSVSLSGT
jgi:hypothetical protein